MLFSLDSLLSHSILVRTTYSSQRVDAGSTFLISFPKLASLSGNKSSSPVDGVVGVDRGPVVITFPYLHNFTLVESSCWLHWIVYHLVPEIILLLG